MSKTEPDDTTLEVEDHLDQAPARVEDLERRLSDELKLRRYTEKVLDKRQEELEMRDAELLQLGHNIRDLKRELKQAQSQLEKTTAQLQTQSTQLVEVKDRIFRLQPTRSDMTESEAKSLYSSMCKGIQRWVESRVASTGAVGGSRFRETPGAMQAYRIVSLMRESGRRCIDISQCDEYHIFAIVMNYLWLALFSRSFYCPLDGSEDNGLQDWVDRTETMMAGQKDAMFSRTWRCDTLDTMVHSSKFQAARDHYLNVLSRDLASFLSVVTLRGTQNELQSSIRKNLIEPAADVAHKLHLAIPVFTLKWPVRHAWSRLEVYDCTNVADGGLPIDFTGTDPKSAARRGAVYLFDLAPGLFVERIESGKRLGPKAISRPRVLVHAGPTGFARNYTTMRMLWNLADPERPPSRANASRA